MRRAILIALAAAGAGGLLAACAGGPGAGGSVAGGSVAGGSMPGGPYAAGGAVTSVDVGSGWAGNSVNVVAFRKNSLVSDGRYQYAAYYDGDGYVVLGRREPGQGSWTLKRTPLRGNVKDAHDAISIMVDGAGILHVSWDHHNNVLHYARADTPGSLDVREAAVVGRDEKSVSYPEFFRLPDGRLVFFYRDGGSGRGNLVLNRYDPATQRWERVADKLIDGEGARSAYWQACVDAQGTIHVSWVWRESPDVASNHDMAYARSRDGGVTWEDSAGRSYRLPITAASAEYAARIPQNSDLINQTSMAADADGNPYVASYWRDAGGQVPQYRVLYHKGGAWHRFDLGFRTEPFSLAGMGTKAIPIARPQLLLAQKGGAPTSGVLVFRDAARGNRASIVRIADVDAGRYTVADLDGADLGAWEPTVDTELWRRQGVLNLFVQPVRQVDGEGVAQVAPTTVRVLAWKPGT